MPLVTEADKVKACIKSSNLWFRIKKLLLKTNMKVECVFVAYIGTQKLKTDFV